MVKSMKMAWNSSKNDDFPLLKSKFCNSTQLCQTYTKMIFELYIIQWYKADMAKHGEYGLFRPLKFEKNGKMEKVSAWIQTCDLWHA